MTEILSPGLLFVLIPLIIIVAGAYASVGLGGGTGYIAVMTLIGVPASTIAPTALLLNIVVTGAALLRFGMAGRVQWRLLLPFLIPAMPAAFLGAFVRADTRIFLGVLGATLAVASLGMFKSASNAQEKEFEPNRFRLFIVAIPSGLVIGFLSGFLGIGGGVFLGPLLLFLGWSGPKSVAAINSALVLILSTVALTAHGIKGDVQLTIVLPLAIAALFGGLVGASLAEKRLSASSLQRVFAVIVLIAAIKAVFDAIGL